MNKDKQNRKVIKKAFVDGNVVGMTESGLCTFLQDDLTCGIYEHRPRWCRTFGSDIDPLMSCPEQDKNGRPRTFMEKVLLHEKVALKVSAYRDRMKNIE